MSQPLRVHACVCRPADVLTREHACIHCVPSPQPCDTSRCGLIMGHSGNLCLGSGTLSHWSTLKEYFSNVFPYPLLFNTFT